MYWINTIRRILNFSGEHVAHLINNVLRVRRFSFSIQENYNMTGGKIQ